MKWYLRVMILVIIFGSVIIVGFTKQNASANENNTYTFGLAYAEVMTHPDSGETGHVIYFRQDVGNAHLSDDFVYDDPRRAALNGGNPGVTYGVKTGFLSSDIHLTDQVGWMHNSFYTWASQACSQLSLTENPVNPSSPGYVAKYYGEGVSDLSLVQADITHIGFLGVGPIFAEGTNVLSVSYTLYWFDEQGHSSDIDNNGKADVAFRETYYNDQFEWSDNGVEGLQPDGTFIFDFPTVAIHEAGHGLSAGHSGSIGFKRGILVANPRAVMNAVYINPLRELTGRDNGIYCSNWAQWPNR
ncbi:MAG: hypothetical protein L0154_16150 [Chloroflexi bacterium]|nr:hypothetical protein [Chloroflexota bacterium]